MNRSGANLLFRFGSLALVAFSFLLAMLSSGCGGGGGGGGGRSPDPSQLDGYEVSAGWNTIIITTPDGCDFRQEVEYGVVGFTSYWSCGGGESHWAEVSNILFDSRGVLSAYVAVVDGRRLRFGNLARIVVESDPISEEPGPVYLLPGGQMALTAVEYDEWGERLDPQPRFTWEVDDPAVASVDNQGKVTVLEGLDREVLVTASRGPLVGHFGFQASSGKLCQPFFPAQTLAADGRNVFYSEFDGDILKVPSLGGPTSFVANGFTGGFDEIEQIVVEGNSLYFLYLVAGEDFEADRRAIGRVDLDRWTVETLISGVPEMTDLAADGGVIYFSSFEGIGTIREDRPEILFLTGDPAFRIEVDGANAYYLSRSSEPGSTLRAVPVGGGASTPMGSFPDFPDELGLALAGDGVFVLSRSGIARISKVDRAQTVVVAFDPQVSFGGGFLADGDFLYYSTKGSLHRVDAGNGRDEIMFEVPGLSLLAGDLSSIYVAADESLDSDRPSIYKVSKR